MCVENKYSENAAASATGSPEIVLKMQLLRYNGVFSKI
jgi:hypothetical protein